MVLSIIRAVLGLILVLFIPGFALVLALYPRKEDLETVERIALSSVLSIALTMLMALFLDMGLGIDYTDLNMVTALVIFTLLCLVAWFIQTGGRYSRAKTKTKDPEKTRGMDEPDTRQAKDKSVKVLNKGVKDQTMETAEEKTKHSKREGTKG